MSSAYDSWSRRFNKALREARGVTVEQARDEDRPDGTMNSLIRDAVGRNRRVVEQDDRGGEK